MAERLLMGPGPSNPYPEVTAALTRPMLGHLDPEFLAIMDETMDRLRTAFSTNNHLTLPISGTGSAGMEAAFVNLVGAGDLVVVGVNGFFGERMSEMASRLGAEVVRVEAPWGSPLDPSELLAAHPSPKIIALVHAETSTGVRNEIERLGQEKGDALLVVDTVTSLGGMEVALDRWAVDVAFSCSQKCLGAPPGLAPFTASERAREQFRSRPSSWYLDLDLISRYVDADSGGSRVYHHTAPVTMICALHAALGVVLQEGLESSWDRHVECGALLRKGLEELGLSLFAAEGHRLAQLTTVIVPEDRLPDGLDEAAFRRLLLDRYGIEIGGGAGSMAGKLWRIGCMGNNARPRNVTTLLGVLDEELKG